ncbi:MAG: YifB family Mg chelatase-like AAA ATPase [Clostridiales bacterium]|nr:YifB family Mg chelatase-like AAA ATPase [Clostridiales bacterium]
MFSKVHSCRLSGIDGYPVEVETDIGNGIPSFDIVGLGDIAIRESKERVKSAIRNSKLIFPVRKITMNLSPANERKEGSAFDLAIAVGILSATCQIQPEMAERFVFIGELSLDGLVKPVRGVLPMTVCARQSGAEFIAVPAANAAEAAIVKGIGIIPVGSLEQLVDHLNGVRIIEEFISEVESGFEEKIKYKVDFCDVRGQKGAKRALEVAASGSHNLMMLGAAGSGKTMLAKRLPTILPPLTFDEAIEVTKIHSIAGSLPKGQSLINARPFRSPHHSITNIGLVGGGVSPKPGEISLAHYGVLFLDELPEFSRSALEVLRQPLEDGSVNVARLNYSIIYPAETMLVCTANPCKCGRYFEAEGDCTCTPRQIEQYRSRISGPLIDRMDIQVEVNSVKYEDLKSGREEENSAAIRERVQKARRIQLERYAEMKIYSNSQLPQAQIEKYCRLDEGCRSLLGKAFERLGLSARAYSRILKVARTIADMEESDVLKPMHIAEAIQYRSLDRKSK